MLIIALIDAYIKAIIKDANCETLEELVNLKLGKEEEYNKLLNECQELNEESNRVLDDKKNSSEKCFKLREALEKKSMAILLAIFGVLGGAALVVALFPNIVSIVLAVVSVLFAGKIGMNAKANLWTSFNESKSELDELTVLESSLSNEATQKLLASLDLMNSIKDVDKVLGTVETFLESYAKSAGIILEEDLINEEVKEDILEESKGRSLH